MIVTSVLMKSFSHPVCYAIISELFTHRDLLLESRSTKGQSVMMGVEMERVRKVPTRAHKVLFCYVCFEVRGY